MQYKKLALPTLLLLFPLAVSAGSVRSMSSNQEITGDDGITYYESGVNCAGKSERIAIRRAKAGGKWCASDAPDFCDRSKLGVAKDVCGRKYDSYLEELAAKGGNKVDAPQQAEPKPAPKAEPKPAPQASPVAKAQAAEKAQENAESMQKQQDQLAIEREKLKIEQERLKLKREQIELQKQELELQRQLKAEAVAKEQAAKKADAARKAEASQKAEAKAKAESASEAPAPSSGVKKNVLGM